MLIPEPYSPYLIQAETFSVRWYGFLIAIAILSSYILILQEIKRSKINENSFDTIFLFTVLSGIIGARLGFVIQDLSYYIYNPLRILFIFDGGLSIHGAIILGSLGLALSCKKNKISFLKLANIISPYLLLSGAIGRWGNYFNQEILGKPSNSAVKLFVNIQNRPGDLKAIEYFHPVFLYESVLLLSAFIVYFLFRKKLQKVALAYTLITYSFARIIVEFWRIDYKPIFSFFDLAQLVSFAIIIFTGLSILTFRRK